MAVVEGAGGSSDGGFSQVVGRFWWRRRIGRLVMTTTSLLGAVARLLRHRWRDHRVRGALSDAALQRLKGTNRP